MVLEFPPSPSSTQSSNSNPSSPSSNSLQSTTSPQPEPISSDSETEMYNKPEADAKSFIKVSKKFRLDHAGGKQLQLGKTALAEPFAKKKLTNAAKIFGDILQNPLACFRGKKSGPATKGKTVHPAKLYAITRDKPGSYPFSSL